MEKTKACFQQQDFLSTDAGGRLGKIIKFRFSNAFAERKKPGGKFASEKACDNQSQLSLNFHVLGAKPRQAIIGSQLTKIYTRSQESALRVLDQWEEFVAGRYRPGKSAFREYEEAPVAVRELYRLNHERQTYDYVLAQHEKFAPGQGERISMWQTLERLNDLVDDSDPDTDLPQIAHALQTAEKIRRDGGPDWMQLVGLIHDSGKMLCFYGEPQWAVVGDSFPVGCAWSEKIVFHTYFAGNPDAGRPELQTELGIYEEGCGIERLQLSWGHDEYLYQVLRDSKLPEAALAMVRYHSFYAWHREDAYTRLMNASDIERLQWVQAFNPYDLYSKSDDAPDVTALRPYYQGLIDKYLPAEIAW